MHGNGCACRNLGILALVLILIAMSSFGVWAGTTTRVSVSSAGMEGNYGSTSPSISATGRWIAFESVASNLVLDDTNGLGIKDVFVRNCVTQETVRVSVASDGTQANHMCWGPDISDGGRYVVFTAYADNLVVSDTNNAQDIFRNDRQTGETRRVSIATDGREANGGSGVASISGDGRFITFASEASNLVDNDTNGSRDIFVHDCLSDATSRVSIASDGTEANGMSSYSCAPISSDGRYVAFESYASNLVLNDTNTKLDVFVHDRVTGETSRVSVASDGAQADGDSYQPSISEDGRFIAFHSAAANLVAGDTNGMYDAFVHDRVTGQTIRVSLTSVGGEANDGGGPAVISADGRYVAFESWSTNIVASPSNGHEQVFVYDRYAGTTGLVSVGHSGAMGDSDSIQPTISSDASQVAFSSAATNLVLNDTNNKADVFVRACSSHGVAIVAGPIGNPNPAASEADIVCSVTAEDSLGHGLTYLWSADAGSFDNPTLPNPTWTAPANTTGSIQEYEIMVTVTCIEDNAVYSGPRNLHSRRGVL